MHKTTKLLLSLMFIFACIFTFKSINAVNLVFEAIDNGKGEEDHSYEYRNYASASPNTRKNYKDDLQRLGLKDGDWIPVNKRINDPSYRTNDILNVAYNNYQVRFDDINTINTNYPLVTNGDKNSAVYYDVLEEAKSTIALDSDINITQFRRNGATISIDYNNENAHSSLNSALGAGGITYSGQNKAPLFVTESIIVKQYRVIGDMYITDYKIDLKTSVLLYKYIGENNTDRVRMSSVGETLFNSVPYGGSTKYRAEMNTSWKFLASVQGFERNKEGNVFGADQNGNYAFGYSGLNAYDNIIKFPMKSERKVFVRNADTSKSPWTSISGTERLSQTTSSGTENNIINDINNSDGQKAKNAGYQESYKLKSNNSMTVQTPNLVTSTYSNGILTANNNQYEYIGYYISTADRFEDLDKNFTFVPVKDKSSLPTCELAGANDNKYVAIVFAYKQPKVKQREVYVNHIDLDTMSKMPELANSSQSGVANMISQAPSNGKYYPEYYKFPTNSSFTLARSTKLNALNRVVINGQTYEYQYLKTSTGTNITDAVNKGGSNTSPRYTNNWTISPSNNIDVTIVSFYYKKVTDGSGSGNDETDIKIDGKLGFKTDFDTKCTTEGGIEYVPTKQMLQPYIENAQKYILPNVNDKNANTSTGKDNYMNHYEQFYQVTVTGVRKSGESKTYHNTFNTDSLVGNTDPNSWMNVYDGRKQPYPVDSTYVGNKNSISPEINIKLSDYKDLANKVIEYSGTEDGVVAYETVVTVTATYPNVSDGKCSDKSSRSSSLDYSVQTVVDRKPKDPAKPVKPEEPDEPECTETYHTEYDWESVTSRKNPDTGEWEVISTDSESRSKECPSSSSWTETEPVNVSYTITLKRKYKLNNLEIYKIMDNQNNVYGISGNGDRTKVLDGGSSLKMNLSEAYMTSIRNRLKTYYQDYTDTKRVIPTSYSSGNFLTTNNDFSSKYTVPADKYNGIRAGTADTRYELYDLALESKRGKEIGKQYTDNTSKTSTQNERINVFSPLTLQPPTIESEDVVDHVENSNGSQGVIQKNAKFTLTPHVGMSSVYTGLDTNQYLKEYYVKFDFIVTNVTVSDGTKRARLEKNSYIKVPAGGWISGIASSENSSDIVGQFKNKIRIIAVANNLRSESNFVRSQLDIETSVSIDTSTDKLKFYTTSELEAFRVFMDPISSMLKGGCSSSNNEKQYNGPESIDTGMTQDGRYIVLRDYETYNIGRIYDFKVTDCTDVNFKNVFRTYNGSVVNQLTGVYFYSGIKRLLLMGNNTNNMVNRSDIGTNPKKLVPLGPYKNTDTTYIQAPKLGYRISFDLKTTGYFSDSTNAIKSKYITIEPSYYYIKKDGTGFNNNIDLYYKNDSGKYVSLKSSGYNIQFKPNDGYRTKPNEYDAPELKYMSTKYETLTIGSTSFRLTSNMMATSNDRFVQNWYGEFKLPNSTIAVPAGGNLNNDRLTDGYIGVKFVIKATETDENGSSRTISYNSTDKNNSSGPNTTQWDYEGYLGYNAGGRDVNQSDKLTIQLEKGTWRINSQEEYNKIKGTVLLYDIDNRAATDFE